MPRLTKLRERSDVEIRLVISAGTTALRNGEADFAIVGGRAAPTDFPSVRLAALDAVVASAPILCDGRAPPNELDDISDYERLDVTTPPGVWRHWFAALGRPAADCRSPRPFDSLHLMYESAAAGLGVALAVPMASERFLADGRLRPCLPDRGVRRRELRTRLAGPRASPAFDGEAIQDLALRGGGGLDAPVRRQGAPQMFSLRRRKPSDELSFVCTHLDG